MHTHWKFTPTQLFLLLPSSPTSLSSYDPPTQVRSGRFRVILIAAACRGQTKPYQLNTWPACLHIENRVFICEFRQIIRTPSEINWLPCDLCLVCASLIVKLPMQLLRYESSIPTSQELSSTIFQSLSHAQYSQLDLIFLIVFDSFLIFIFNNHCDELK